MAAAVGAVRGVRAVPVARTVAVVRAVAKVGARAADRVDSRNLQLGI